MRKHLAAFWHDQGGGTMVEYALISALIAVAGVVGMVALTDGIKTLFGAVASNFETANPPN